MVQVQLAFRVWSELSVTYLRVFKCDYPTCEMSKEEVESLYSLVMPSQNVQVFVDRMFQVFDTDGNGLLSFQVTVPNILSDLKSL